MVNFKKLTDRAKDVVDKRGGMDSLKEDAQELRGVAKGEGSLKDKAKAAAEAVKEPGASGSQSGGDAGGREATESGRGSEEGRSAE